MNITEFKITVTGPLVDRHQLVTQWSPPNPAMLGKPEWWSITHCPDTTRLDFARWGEGMPIKEIDALSRTFPSLCFSMAGIASEIGIAERAMITGGRVCRECYEYTDKEYAEIAKQFGEEIEEDCGDTLDEPLGTIFDVGG